MGEHVALASLCGLLVIPACFKLFELGFTSVDWSAIDPVVGIRRSTITLATALLEFGIVGLLMSGKYRSDGILLTSGAAAIFLVYHLVLDKVAPYEICPCLGNAPLWAGISRKTSALLSWVLLCAVGTNVLCLWVVRRTVNGVNRNGSTAHAIRR